MWDNNLTFTENNVTATKNGNTIDLGAAYNHLDVRVDVTAISGSGATLTPKFQESPDGTTWTDIVTLPAMTATGTIRQAIRTTQRYIRYVMTIAGTSPSVSAVFRVR